MKNQIEDIYSLSPTQEGILYHYLSEPSSGNYIVQIVFAASGDWQVTDLERSLTAVLAKYQVLRTVFLYKNLKRAQQVVLKKQQANVDFEDISHLTTEQQQKHLQDFYHASRASGFNLSKEALLRLALFRTASRSYKLVFTSHHIVLDGWSLPLVLDDFFRFYELSKRNQSIPNESVSAYSNYINWLSEQDKEEALAYWKEYLTGYEEVTTLPQYNFNATAVSQNTRSILKHTVKFPRLVTEKLQVLTATHNTTLGTVFQALWALVLQRYSGQDDIVFGWVTSGRPPELPDVEQMVGLFISTVPTRVKLKRQETSDFSTLLKELKDANLQRQPYEYIGLSEIQQQGQSKGQLFNNLVVFQNYSLPDQTGEEEQETDTIYVEKSTEQTNYDFDVVVVPGEEIKISFDYNAHLYPDWLVQNIGDYLVQLAEVIALNPEISLQNSEIVALLPREQALLRSVNTTQRSYRQDQTLADLFEEQVERSPHQVALVYEGKQLSYQQLNRQANQVAYYLQTQYALQPDDRVALLMERSDSLIIGMLGILKAGAAYVPLDPAYPEQRQRAILQESDCKVVLTHSSAITLPCPGLDITSISGEEAANPHRATKPQHLAYVIYSSGTTGKPKGIMIEHRSIVNLLYYYNERYKIPQLTGILQLTNVVIDIALQEVFSALMNGLPLYVPGKELVFDSQALRKYIQEHRISFIQLVPDTLREYLAGQAKLEDLQVVLCGGEKLPDKLKDSILEQGYSLYNVYGQTETTIDAIISHCRTEESNLNEVVANYQVYILNKQNQHQPLGVVGEICIGGVGVGRGYLNEDELTNEKFIKNPFGEGRLYKTGDLGRWLTDGRLEFIGRADTQVKIRGYRVELSEVEKGLLSHLQVREAVVVAQEGAGQEKYLCAYYTTHGTSLSKTNGLPTEQLRKYLQGKLPTYMIPAYLVELSQLPVNANGKIDQTALPVPDRNLNSKDYLAPRNEIEEKLIEVWQDVLKIERIGLNDNFFELGGDSIKAIQVISRLQQKGFKLSVSHLMQYPRIKEASRQVKPLTITLDQGLVTGEVKLTPVQQWFFDFNFTDLDHYSMPWMLYRIDGFEEQYVRQVLEALVLQHDSLRMVYQQDQGKVKQYNRGREGVLYELEVISVQDAKEESTAIAQAATQLHSSISLVNGPLVKAALFQTSDGDHLLLSVHHIVMDAVSWRIFLEDFATAYEQLEQRQPISLPAKTSSFQQWAEAVHAYAHSSQMQEEVAYWQQVEKDLLNSTLSLERSTGTTADLAQEWFALNEQETSQLQQEVHKAYGTQMNDILLTALGLSLRDWSEQDKHVIMLEGHGREEVIPGVDVSRTIGWFTAHFLQPLYMQHGYDLSYQLRYVKEQIRQVPNKGIGYEIWKHILEKDQSAERIYPLINFNYLGEFTDVGKDSSFKPSPYSYGTPTSPACELVTDILIIGSIQSGKLTFDCAYNSKRFTQQQIKHLMTLFNKHLINIIAHCVNQTQQALTPSDYSANDLSLDDLALLQGKFNNLSK